MTVSLSHQNNKMSDIATKIYVVVMTEVKKKSVH